MERSWLKMPPRKPPDDPETIDLVSFNARANLLEQKTGKVPAFVTYVRQNGPKLTFDEWGQALPLSPMEQSDLDRLVAVLMDPVTRFRDLLTCGRLNDDEVQAVSAVYPEVYAAVVNAAVKDMIVAQPPFALWAQSVLGILFQKPATEMYASTINATDEIGRPKENRASPGLASPPDAIPTPQDRRDTAIRQQARK